MATDVNERGAFSAREIRTVARLADVLLPEGHDLPSASAVKVAHLLDENIALWDRTNRSGLRWLIRMWEISPLLSRHHTRFSFLELPERVDYVERAMKSKVAAKRLCLLALKQLILLVWASTSEVEDALGYDYRCIRDDEPHGTVRVVIAAKGEWRMPPEPDDYARPGPAVASGAVPAARARVRDFRPVDPESTRLRTVCWPEVTDGARVNADVVVVGSGAGGAVAAATLAEAGARVVVVEEGPQVSAEQDFSGPTFARFQRLCRDNATSLIWGRPPIPLPLGRVVGGTTVVNSGTCFRAPARVLRRWETEYGVDEVADGGLDHHFEAIEDALNVRPVPWELLGPNGMAAHRGATALGYSGGPLLRNIADCHGCGQCAFGCPTDAKQAMHVSYLPRAERAGAVIYSRSRVERITLEDGRAVGVTAAMLDERGRPRGRLTIEAPQVVVSAGAIHTPALLSRSGIADPSRQTGRNLRIHPATGVAALFGEGWRQWKGTLQSYYIDQFFDSHELMFEATTAVPSVGAGSISSIGAEAMTELGALGQLATLGFYVSDTSRGRVTRLSRGRALATYRLNQMDSRRMGKGLAVAAEVLLAAGASRVFVGLPGHRVVASRRDLESLQQRVRPDHLRLTAFHPMGTARMGADPERAVLDPYGRHHVVSGLWVADASVFPSCVGVNPQITIMAFARRTAERLMS